MRSVIRQAKTVDEAVNEALEILSIDRSDMESVNVVVLEEPKAGLFGIFGAKDAVVKVSVEDDLVSELINEVFNDDNKQEEEKIIPEEKVVKEDEEIVKQEDKNFEKVQDDIVEPEGTISEAEISEDESSDIKEVVKTDDINETSEEDLAKDQDEIETVDKSESIEESIEESVEDEKKIITENDLLAPDLLRNILEGMKIEGDLDYSIEDNTVNIKIINTNQRDTSIIIGKRGDTLDSIQYILNLAENRQSDSYIRVNLDISNYREKRKESLIKLANNMSKKAISQNRNIRLEPMNAYERKIIHSVLQDVEGIETYSEGKEPRRRLVIKVKN